MLQLWHQNIMPFQEEQSKFIFSLIIYFNIIYIFKKIYIIMKNNLQFMLKKNISIFYDKV